MHQTPTEMVHELAAMTDALRDYLLDERLFKTITVHSPSGDHLIKMTLGGMLERIEALEEMPNGGDAEAVVRHAKEALARARENLPQQYYEKLGREAKSYTDSWNWFLQNCWEGDVRCRNDYAQEVSIRLRLERLLSEAENRAELADSRTRIQKLDERLSEIWESEDEPLIGTAERYPRERFWWLYGRPRPRDNG